MSKVCTHYISLTLFSHEAYLTAGFLSYSRTRTYVAHSNSGTFMFTREMCVDVTAASGIANVEIEVGYCHQQPDTSSSVYCRSFTAADGMCWDFYVCFHTFYLDSKLISTFLLLGEI